MSGQQINWGRARTRYRHQGALRKNDQVNPARSFRPSAAERIAAWEEAQRQAAAFMAWRERQKERAS